jgi:hypothetical protein
MLASKAASPDADGFRTTRFRAGAREVRCIRQPQARKGVMDQEGARNRSIPIDEAWTLAKMRTLGSERRNDRVAALGSRPGVATKKNNRAL